MYTEGKERYTGISTGTVKEHIQSQIRFTNTYTRLKL